MKNKQLKIKNEVLRYMDEKLISQADLERHFNLSAGAISKWFSKGIPPKRLRELCEFLSLDYELQHKSLAH